MALTQDVIDSMFRLFMPPPPKTTLVPVPFERKLDPNASQSDKPSPSSMYTDRQLMRMKKEGFPVPEFEILTVQDTNSMEPWVDHGDIVTLRVLKSVDKKFVRPGVVATYRSGRDLVLHRVEEEKMIGGVRSFRFKGINNYRSDPSWIPEAMVEHICTGVDWGVKLKDD